MGNFGDKPPTYLRDYALKRNKKETQTAKHNDIIRYARNGHNNIFYRFRLSLMNGLSYLAVDQSAAYL